MLKLSEQTKIESQIGFNVGILIGVLSSWIFILFFTDWQWYFKLFSSIGEVGIVGSLLFSINELRKIRRNFIEAKQEMEIDNEYLKGG